MDKAIQNNEELQDDELYALLDKAWETEKLCVSEELIQKTLKRAAEETDSKVVSMETAVRRRSSLMKYAGVAVAALFVAVLGLKVLGNGGLPSNHVKMESAADGCEYELSGKGVHYDGAGAGANSAKANSDALMDDSVWYSSAEMSQDSQNVSADEEKATESPEAKDAIRGEREDGLFGTTVTLSKKLTEILTESGNTPVYDTAECWEFAEGGTDWEAELFHTVAAAMSFDRELPYSGTYRYVLEVQSGTQKVLEYNEPLDFIVRIETEKGILWGLFGENKSFVME